MTKDEWIKVEAELSHPWGSVKLMVDGYALTLAVKPYKPLKYLIMVFVDGIAKGEWIKGEADEAKRFCHKVTKPLYSPAQKKSLTQGLSKAFVKKHLADLDETMSFWEPYWSTFGPLKRHLIANNKSIEFAPEKSLEDV